MWEAYSTHNNPDLYLRPQQPGEQPPPTSCIETIQVRTTKLVRQTHKQLTLRGRLELPAATAKHNSQNNRLLEHDKESHNGDPPAKQRRLPIGGIFNPDLDRRPFENV